VSAACNATVRRPSFWCKYELGMTHTHVYTCACISGSMCVHSLLSLSPSLSSLSLSYFSSCLSPLPLPLSPFSFSLLYLPVPLSSPSSSLSLLSFASLSPRPSLLCLALQIMTTAFNPRQMKQESEVDYQHGSLPSVLVSFALDLRSLLLFVPFDCMFLLLSLSSLFPSISSLSLLFLPQLFLSPLSLSSFFLPSSSWTLSSCLFLSDLSVSYLDSSFNWSCVPIFLSIFLSIRTPTFLSFFLSYVRHSFYLSFLRSPLCLSVFSFDV